VSRCLLSANGPVKNQLPETKDCSVTGTPKRKISAKEFVSDVRSGMNESELKQRYELSDDALKKVFSRLTAAGLLTEHEIPRGIEATAGGAQLSRREEDPSWRCPSCGAAQAEAVEECPECGVIVEKFLARQKLGEHVPIAVVRDDSGGSWPGVVASIVVCIVVSTGLVYWATHRAREKAYVPAKIAKPQTFREIQGSGGSHQSEAPDGETQGRWSENESSSSSSGPPEPPPQSPIASKENSPLPQENRVPSGDKYRTGVLREFSSKDFKEEVVEASKTYPVIFQFYSST
jgi:rubrerythrin